MENQLEKDRRLTQILDRLAKELENQSAIMNELVDRGKVEQEHPEKFLAIVNSQLEKINKDLLC